jgi:hypothetical protein
VKGTKTFLSDRDVYSGKAWRDFIVWVSNVYIPEWDAPAPSIGIDATPSLVEYLELRLRRLPTKKEHDLIPWFWREAAYFPAPNPKLKIGQARYIQDWYVGSDEPIDIFRYTLETAKQAADAWHQEFEQAALHGEIKLTRKQRRALKGAKKFFVPLLTWPDGSWLGLHYADPDYIALRAVGQVLGHCYRKLDLADRYSAKYEMLVLFDQNNRPHFTIAAEEQHSIWPEARWWRSEEIRGVGNIFPAKEFHAHLGRVLDLPPEGFSPPPGAFPLGVGWPVGPSHHVVDTALHDAEGILCFDSDAVRHLLVEGNWPRETGDDPAELFAEGWASYVRPLLAPFTAARLGQATDA